MLPKSSEKPTLSASSLASYKRDSYNGYGNGLAKAFELTMTPALFGGIGYLIDRKADTKPMFMIGLILFAIVGMFIRMWYGYDDEMKHHEKSMVRSGPSAGSPSPTDATPVNYGDAIPERITLPTGVTLDTDPSDLTHQMTANTSANTTAITGTTNGTTTR